jgi:hypothetical protein
LGESAWLKTPKEYLWEYFCEFLDCMVLGNSSIIEELGGTGTRPMYGHVFPSFCRVAMENGGGKMDNKPMKWSYFLDIILTGNQVATLLRLGMFDLPGLISSTMTWGQGIEQCSCNVGKKEGNIGY